MAVNLSPIGGVAAQFFDNSGNILSGGKIFTYAAGTTTPQASYTSASGATAHANPIILDAAGRVPGGEIWLTDGFQYKFLIKTSTDVQIGSYDNINGINANFVNYTTSQELQTATAGQTVFTLTTMVYQPGTNSLSVFVDGVNQYGPGALYAYQETSATVVTFTAGLHVGADVKFTTSAINASSYGNATQIAFTGFNGSVGNVSDLAGNTGADLVGFTQSGAGAIPRSVQNKLRETVSIKDFGAVGDGSNNDTAAFLSFQSWATALTSDTMVVLNFDRGAHYMVNDPRWPMDIANLTVNGNGATLQNNAASGAPLLNKQLLITAWGLDNVTSWPTPGPLTDNYFLNTTTPGVASVTTSTAANAGNFTAGENVLVASWNTQFAGFPPNYKFFEYKKVVSVNAGTGVVTLDSPIQYTHQSNFPYLSSSSTGEGRATIFKLDQASLWGINHTYNDIVFKANAVPVTFDCIYITGRSIKMVGCTAPYFLPSQVGTVHLQNCLQTAEDQVSTEIDKLITNVVLEDCVWMDKLNSASSVTNFEAIRSQFNAGYSLTAPTNVKMIDCIVAANSQNDVQLLDQYQITNNLLISGGTHSYYPSFSVVSGQLNTVTINGSTITWTPATSTLFVNFGTNAVRQSFANKLVPGALVFVTGASGGEDLPTGPSGIVRSVTGGNGTVSAVVDFNAILAGTEQLSFYPEPNVTNITGTDIAGVRDYVTLRHTEVSYRNLRLTGGLAFSNQKATGRPVELLIDVKRPYTGSTGGNITAQFYDNYPNYLGFNYSVNLKAAGLRAISLYGSRGWSGTNGESVGAAFTAGAYAAELFGKYDLFVSTMAVVDDDEYPIVDITLRLASPFNNLGY